MPTYTTLSEALAAVQQDGCALEYVTDQTPELCLAAVPQNGRALCYVTDPTPEICLAAVQQNGCALEYVTDQTPEICLAAVRKNGYALQYVTDPVLRIQTVRHVNNPKEPMTATEDRQAALDAQCEALHSELIAAWNLAPRTSVHTPGFDAKWTPAADVVFEDMSSEAGEEDHVEMLCLLAQVASTDTDMGRRARGVMQRIAERHATFHTENGK